MARTGEAGEEGKRDWSPMTIRNADTYYISKTERVYILLLGLTISIVSAVNMLAVYVEQVSHPDPFVIYDISRADQYPLGRFLSIFITLFLYFGTRYFVSLGWTVLCLTPFVYELSQRYHAIYNYPDLLYKTPGLQILKMIANPLDYLAVFLMTFLLGWLVTVIVRSFTLKKNVEQE